MGCFDTIYLAPEINEHVGIGSCACGQSLVGMDWQTRGLGCGMQTYGLKQTEDGIRLFKLDLPDDFDWEHPVKVSVGDRVHRRMGDLPHGRVEFDTLCDCNAWHEYTVKFMDGKAVSFEKHQQRGHS